ncbi:MAG: LysR family transcriptional regulator [Deltaproteobacteria bacterium]|nr:LysR family transcriptional regulator [Deltaproteobacteria bacterium]
MKIHEMALLVRVAETGSMTTAAQQLHLTPAAVSAAIRRIEEALGVRLFERTTRSVQPTGEGLVVLDGCHDVLERWQRTLDEVEGPTPELTGTVHLSAPADTTYQLIGPVVVAVSEAHPRLRVVVHSSDAVQHLHREAIDLAIRYGALRDSTLSARKLTAQPRVLVAAPSYLERHPAPTTLAELADHRCVTLMIRGVPASSWTLRDHDGEHEVVLEDPLCGDGHLSRRWALAGVGIALKSLFDVIDDLEAGHLVHVLPTHLGGPYPLHLLTPSRRYQPARVRVLGAAIEEAIVARSARCDRWLAG